ncbi:MAG: 50S ribosomal protein L15 [Anaerolineales bacterium]|nr:50S ribosomal protein L15 [Anaerolineales bacterium]
MKLHELKPNKGSKKDRKRVGRGYGSGYGKTSGRGMNGQNSRAGGGVPLYHQGGDTPFYRRMPKKPGFKNFNRVEYQEVNLEYLSQFRKDSIVTPEVLREKDLINTLSLPVVILSRGDLDKPLKVKAHRFSRKAVEKIEKAGGTVEVIES